MADYNPRAKSLITGLSDFWQLYFKEYDQLDFFYKGAEVQLGQSYLDLMSLLLNNSVQDTAIFNKEFFKLLVLSETDLAFRQGAAPSANRFQYVLPDNVQEVPYLNNKILSPTESLERDIDYFAGDTGVDARLDFTVDPTNAYKQRTFGAGYSAINIRARVTGTEGDQIAIWFNDDGSSLSVTRVGYDITVSYDGPANTGTTTAAQIASGINTTEAVQGLIFADLENREGSRSPSGTLSFVSLERAEFNVLDGFANRQVVEAFGGQLTSTGISDWVEAGVQKGDILRVISGRGIGEPQELSVSLVRRDAIYVRPQTPIVETSSGKVDFAVLREPYNNSSTNESIAASGQLLQSGADGSVDAVTRIFSAPTGVFSTANIGDVIQITSGDNVGIHTIRDVDTSAPYDSVTLLSTGLTTELTGAIDWQLYSNLDASFQDTTGTIISPGNVLTTALVPPSDVVGSLLKISQGGVNQITTVTGAVDMAGTWHITFEDVDFTAGACDGWGLANYIPAATTLIYAPPLAWPRADNLTVKARRLSDGLLVEKDVDYTLNEDTGVLRAISVWQTSLSNTASYTFTLAVVQNVTPLASASDGSITPGSTNTFTTPLGPFTDAHVGFALRVSNSALPSPQLGPPGTLGATNNGTHTIANVLSPTTVELTGDSVVSDVVDANNGSLEWELLRRGTTESDDVTADVSQIAFWAPDVLVDRFNLYVTFGYLISKFERSSESYRSLIRGIFQLFMLGPTLERFESAINTVAGLPVIRDEDELLISYDSGALASGTDGTFAATSNSFTAPGAAFTASDVGKSIFAADGNNAGKLFEIIGVVSSTQVTLNTTPLSGGPDSWELIGTALQTVTTSRREYTFARTIPLKDKFTDPSNFGLLTLRAFEVITSVFLVTDDVETPRWWQNSTIPFSLWDEPDGQRRSSTGQLFENVISPADGGQIGDPGFVIGGDDEGFVPPKELLPGGGSNGTIIGDPLFPASNNVFFEDTVASNFTEDDIGNIINIPAGGQAQNSFVITGYVSADRVQVESFVSFLSDVPGLTWELRSGAIARRHNAAFVILDRWLKHNIFFVSFDSSLLSTISAELLTDLQELVFVAKPEYDYLILTPSALLKEIIRIEEDEIEQDILLLPGGGAGEQIVANESNLNIIGESWRIGQWFRQVSQTSTFSTPLATLTNATGTPDAGYEHKVNRFITDAAFTSSSERIQIVDRIQRSVHNGSDGEITVVGGVRTLTSAAGGFDFEFLMGRLIITGSGAGNDGTYGIGQVVSPTELVLSGPSMVNETGLTFEIKISGGYQGVTSTNTDQKAHFQDIKNNGVIQNGDTNTIIRRPFLGGTAASPLNAAGFFEFADITADNEGLLLAPNARRVEPLESDPDFTGSLSSGVLTVAANTAIFNDNMSLFVQDPAYNPHATPPIDTYTLHFTSGVNSGLTASIGDVHSATSVSMAAASGSLSDDAAVQFYITRSTSPVVEEEGGNWEYLKRQIVIEGNTIDFSNGPSQDPALVSYTAYGVRVPIDPVSEVFDDSQGDTLYSIGMPDPAQHNGRSRTGLDADLREEPIQITRT